MKTVTIAQAFRDVRYAVLSRITGDEDWKVVAVFYAASVAKSYCAAQIVRNGHYREYHLGNVRSDQAAPADE